MPDSIGCKTSFGQVSIASWEEKIANFRALERPMAHYFGRGLAEHLFKLGALMTTCYTSLGFDLSCYVIMLQLVH